MKQRSVRLVDKNCTMNIFLIWIPGQKPYKYEEHIKHDGMSRLYIMHGKKQLYSWFLSDSVEKEDHLKILTAYKKILLKQIKLFIGKQLDL